MRVNNVIVIGILFIFPRLLIFLFKILIGNPIIILLLILSIPRHSNFRKTTNLVRKGTTNQIGRIFLLPLGWKVGPLFSRKVNFLIGRPLFFGSFFQGTFSH